MSDIVIRGSVVRINSTPKDVDGVDILPGDDTVVTIDFRYPTKTGYLTVEHEMSQESLSPLNYRYEWDTSSLRIEAGTVYYSIRSVFPSAGEDGDFELDANAANPDFPESEPSETHVVKIGEINFQSYGTLQEADNYLMGATHASSWRDLTSDDDKKRLLVTATRLINRQRFKDAYNTFDLRVEEENIVNACFELAVALQDGSDVQETPNNAPKLSSIRAGSVALTYFMGFQPTSPSRFPQIVQELLRDYLNLGMGTLSGVATGTDGESVTENDFGFNRGL